MADDAHLSMLVGLCVWVRAPPPVTEFLKFL